MYCTNCGAKNDNDANFCVKCRSPLGGENYIPSNPSKPDVRPIPTPGTPVKPAYRSKPKYITPLKIGTVAIVVVIIAIVVMVSGITRPSPKKTLDNYLKAVCITKDADDALKELPKSYINSKGESALKKKILEAYEWYQKYNLQLSYEITSVEDVSEIELLDIKSEYEKYGENVKDAKKANIELTMTGDLMGNGETDTRISTESVYIVKIKGSWYVDSYNSNI